MKGRYATIVRVTVLSICAASLAATVGCAGVSRNTETQSGLQIVTSRPFDIIGVIRRTATSENQRGGSGIVRFDETIGVPVGTDVIVPAVYNWLVGFGRIDPDDLSGDSSGRITFTVTPGQRPLGAELVSVSIFDINAPSGGRQTATIRHEFYLTDENNDDDWFAVVSYHLLFLSFADE